MLKLSSRIFILIYTTFENIFEIKNNFIEYSRVVVSFSVQQFSLIFFQCWNLLICWSCMLFCSFILVEMNATHRQIPGSNIMKVLGLYSFIALLNESGINGLNPVLELDGDLSNIVTI